MFYISIISYCVAVDYFYAGVVADTYSNNMFIINELLDCRNGSSGNSVSMEA